MDKSTLVTGLGVGALTIGTSAAIVSTSYVSLHEWIKNAAHLPYKYQQLPCSSKLFKEINWEIPPTTSSEPRTDSKEDKKFERIKDIRLGNENAKGCLAIWWERLGGKDANWTGNWNVLWGLRDGTHGMIFMFSLNTRRHYSENSMSIYVLKKEDTSDKWNLLYKDFGAGTYKFDASSIVKPGNTLDKRAGGWCFLPGVDSSQQDCPSNKRSEKLNWDLKPNESTGQSVDGWTNSIDNLFTAEMKKIYQNLKGSYVLEQTQE